VQIARRADEKKEFVASTDIWFRPAQFANAPDGNFFVYLEDVDERQHVHYVTEGALRGIHRKISQEPPPYQDIAPYHSYKKADAMPLVPGQIAELTFDLQPISYLFRKGHSIRVAFAGADRDNFEDQPIDASVVTYYREPAHASRIVLPVVERNK
jgi:putative CocE/NonD family hydrolase